MAEYTNILTGLVWLDSLSLFVGGVGLRDLFLLSFQHGQIEDKLVLS